ncbi:unnamed protein product [Rotaria sp. Silwood2]|nr:unnamed protein product [Rotaria sp. Silwood2]
MYNKRLFSIKNNTSLSLQSFVNDIPFEFNSKYRTIIVSNRDIPEYDNTSKIHDILSKLKTKFYILREQTSSSITNTANCQLSDSSCVSTNILSVNHPSSSSHRSLLSKIDHKSVIDTFIPLKIVSSYSSSFCLTSVRDIYWSYNNQQEYNIPMSINSSKLSSNPVKQSNNSFNNCNSIYKNDLAAIFDESLTFDDSFHDAELKLFIFSHWIN